jgi:hypothetical protein
LFHLRKEEKIKRLGERSVNEELEPKRLEVLWEQDQTGEGLVAVWP